MYGCVTREIVGMMQAFHNNSPTWEAAAIPCRANFRKSKPVLPFRPPICGGPGPVALPFRVLSPALPKGAGRTVFRCIGEGHDRSAADAAASDGLFLHDRRIQLPVSRKDGGAEIFADQHRRDELGAWAEVSIIQWEAISAVIVGAQAAD